MGGTTWSSAIRVNDDPIKNGVWQDMVWASYNKDNQLVVVWRDRRNGAGTGYDQSSDTYCAVSSDNGNTFQPNIRLSTVSAAYNTVLLDKGNDFMSCQLIADTVYASWGDVRNGSLNIYFTKCSVTTGKGTGLQTVNAGDDETLTLYPNPANDKVRIILHTKNSFQKNLVIVNEKGQQVLQSVFNNSPGDNSPGEKTIDLSMLPPGMYTIQISINAEPKFSQKLIISRP